MKLGSIRLIGVGIVFLVLVLGLLFIPSYFEKGTPPISPVLEPAPSPPSLTNIREELLAHLKQESEPQKTQGTIELPLPPPPEMSQKKPQKPVPLDKRAQGRQERKSLPLGVALIDQVSIYEKKKIGKPLYTLITGDFVRVFPNESDELWLKVQPGVDVYLAATSKQFEAAGNRFPDVPGWVQKTNIHIFDPAQAVEFTQEITPMTVGPTDTRFSTLAFYERGMKNPDPVVHRVMGPRLIGLLLLHEDYDVSSWGRLYRDHDSKIRSVTLAFLRKRGVGHNREIIEDLIKRLAELTQRRVQGESQAEVLAILNILKESKHPRVPTALESFRDTWKNTQNKEVVETLDSILN